MLCLGFEPGAAALGTRTDPLSHGGRPLYPGSFVVKIIFYFEHHSYHQKEADQKFEKPPSLSQHQCDQILK